MPETVESHGVFANDTIGIDACLGYLYHTLLLEKEHFIISLLEVKLQNNVLRISVSLQNNNLLEDVPA